MAGREPDLAWPLGKLQGINRDDLWETAYEIFFTSCRSKNSDNNMDGVGVGLPTGSGPGKAATGVGMAVTSRIKKALGLKMMRRAPLSRRTIPYESVTAAPSSPGAASSPRPRRPLTSAEIMRRQMRVTEEMENRLRKTLTRTLVGQMGRRVETTILPLELLRHVKPSEFSSSNEYHHWQKRQLKLLQTGLLHPSTPIDMKSNTCSTHLNDIIRASESKPIDTSKNSETMRTLCSSVVSLSWRDPDTDVCHWADGYPLNAYIYIMLLHSIFDLKDGTLVLDEVDELLELMRKTWTSLGINKAVHNLCFTWVLFEQYVVMSQSEPELLRAFMIMLDEVSSDIASKADRETALFDYVSSSVLGSMRSWSEKKLLEYHDHFDEDNVGSIENLIYISFTVRKVVEGDVEGEAIDPKRSWVDNYIRNSVRNAFTKITEEGNSSSKAMIKIAEKAGELAVSEKKIFSSVLNQWHPNSASVAAVTLHSCYGTLLKQYLSSGLVLTNEMVIVLQKAGRLETVLVKMVGEDSGEEILKEMVPYEVESVIMNLLNKWIDQKLMNGRECIHRAEDNEKWSPKSKTDQYANSGVELVRLIKEAVDEFFQFPICIFDYLVQDLADGLEDLFLEYTNFVSSCGFKEKYIPKLPPLTRCTQDSKFIKLWKMTSQCSVGTENASKNNYKDGPPRASMTRGTQQLYIRLNTLNYLFPHINALHKIISLYQSAVPTKKQALFDLARSSVKSAILHVSEVAAYRFIFTDTRSVFHDSLYVNGIENARIGSALRVLKENLTLLKTILIQHSQDMAINHVARVCFEAYLMVLLAGGKWRSFSRSDQGIIKEDFKNLKMFFSASGDFLTKNNELVTREVEIVEGVITLMGESSKNLVKSFCIVTRDMSVEDVMGSEQGLQPRALKTGRWNREDPSTLLRVLCHRNDDVANQFLKKTFQLTRRLR